MVLLANTLLTTQSSKVVKHRCFPIEIAAKGLAPKTNYNAFFDGVNVNAFIKPYGKNLGTQIISDAKGQIKALFLMNINYNENFITNTQTTAKSITRNRVLTLVDPNGNATTSYIPTLQKPTR
jgi:hypothetical protein